MIVRALDEKHDWTFGKGRNNYLKNLTALMQNIDTRLKQFLGDCFFDVGDGIDWPTILGSKDQLGAQLIIQARILNTEGVTGISQLSLYLSAARELRVAYQVNTIYGSGASDFALDAAA